jgi:hypothetical protein
MVFLLAKPFVQVYNPAVEVNYNFYPRAYLGGVKMRKVVLVTSLLMCVLGVQSCGKSGGGSQKADENKPVAEIKAEAAKLDVEQLRAVALKYKDALMAKEDEVKKLTDTLAKIPITEKLGKEAQALSADISDLGKSVSALKERFQIYYDEIKKKGGELKDLTLYGSS